MDEFVSEKFEEHNEWGDIVPIGCATATRGSFSGEIRWYRRIRFPVEELNTPLSPRGVATDF